MIVERGSNSVIATIFIQSASSTTGAGLTGLTASSSGLAACYRAQGASSGFTPFTLATATLGTWSSGGFREVDSANAPGVYEIGLPNAALAAGIYVDFYFQGAANMAPAPLKVDLVAYNPQDAIRLGLTSLPNAAAGASGGLPTGNASGQVIVAGYASGQDPGSMVLATPPNKLATDSSGRVTVGTNADKTGYSLSGAVTVGSYASGEDPATLVWNALTASFDTANSFGAYLQSLSGGGGGGGSGPTLTEIVDGVWNEPASSHTSSGTFGALISNAAGDAASAVLTTAMTESYSVAGSTKTLAQGVYEIAAILSNLGQVGTTLTSYRLDTVTPAMSFSLDSASAPTVRKRTA